MSIFVVHLLESLPTESATVRQPSLPVLPIHVSIQLDFLVKALILAQRTRKQLILVVFLVVLPEQ